ncbi:MAG TPA: BMP family ABC transporter substrate-binding protein [Micromonosporaceae bacterium]
MLVAGLAACGQTGRHKGLKVGLAYAVGGPGDDGFNDLALAGLNRARTELAGSVGTVRALTARDNETEEDQYQRLSLLCEAGYDPVIAVGYTYAGRDPATGPLARAAKDCPKTRFAIVDDDTVSQPNVANLVFADQQGAFLVGVVAADKSSSGVIGFVGACDIPLINRFLAGYQAGATAVRPDIQVKPVYLPGSDCDFTSVDAARTAAAGLYSAGADVVFQVAGGAGIGVFQAAQAAGGKAIGVDADQYDTVGADLRGVILTSMLKRVDIAVFDFIKTITEDAFVAGVKRYDLADGGLSYATSGGQIDDLVPQLNEYKQKIVSGSIVVPTTP